MSPTERQPGRSNIEPSHQFRFQLIESVVRARYLQSWKDGAITV
ncbi:hypothetical protein BH10PLA2_BH10PLA2_36990 [soil metagenome]